MTIFLAWSDPRLMISRRPVLQMLRSMLLLGTTLFGMLALKIMPLVDFSAIVWVAPVLVAALSVFILHEKVSPCLWASVFAGLISIWVIIGRTGMDFSLSMLFPFLAALANALYQIPTRLLHGADSSFTTLFYSALAGVLFCGGFLPFAAAAPNLVDGGLGLFGIASHFCLIRAFCRGACEYRRAVRLYRATLGDFVQPDDFRGNSRPRSLFGAALIVGAGLFIFLGGRKI